jgi:hypothetical protein
MNYYRWMGVVMCAVISDTQEPEASLKPAWAIEREPDSDRQINE